MLVLGELRLDRHSLCSLPGPPLDLENLHLEVRRTVGSTEDLASANNLVDRQLPTGTFVGRSSERHQETC